MKDSNTDVNQSTKTGEGTQNTDAPPTQSEGLGPLEIDWKGMFVSALLLVILILMAVKLVWPAMQYTSHNPANVLEQSNGGTDNANGE